LLLRIGDDSSDELFVYEHRLLPAQDIGPVGP